MRWWHLLRPRPNARSISTQHIATYCCAQHVAHVWSPCCNMLRVVGPRLKTVNFSRNILNVACCCTRLATFLQHCCAGACVLVRFAISKRHPACCNLLQQGRQTCVALNVACVWPASSHHLTTWPSNVALKFCERFAGAWFRSLYLGLFSNLFQISILIRASQILRILHFYLQQKMSVRTNWCQ